MLIFKDFLEFLRTVDLSPIDAEILLILEVYGPRLSYRYISGKIDVPTSTLSSALSRLKRKGFVNREVALDDVRKSFYEITREGQDRLPNLRIHPETIETSNGQK